jgi:hypothetical protein
MEGDNMSLTKDVIKAAEIRAGLEALSVETILLRRRIHDRHGARPIATIEYTVEEFAAKLADGITDAGKLAYVAPELRQERKYPSRPDSDGHWYEYWADEGGEHRGDHSASCPCLTVPQEVAGA